MRQTSSPTGSTGQPYSAAALRAAGDQLDKLARDNATAFAALDSTRSTLRQARSAYFAMTRAAAAKRPAPRLPAGTGDDARAVVQAALDAARADAVVYRDLCELGDLGGSFRDRADAAARMERSEAIFDELKLAFNARVEKEWQRGETAQARAFEATEYAAERQRGVVRHFPSRRTASIRKDWNAE